MTFVHPLLLGGLLLVGLPILLHLVTRQKPIRLPFPALRFLAARQRTNQRRLQIRHLLLLLLRMFLIAAVCLALARPKLFNDRLNLSSNRPVAAVIIFDTSASMGYKSGDRTRLDEAKRRALELMTEFAEGSKVAVLNSANTAGDDWLPNLSLARERVGVLEIRPANQPVTSQLAHAYELFTKLDAANDGHGEGPLPFLYVFSDRTAASWDDRRIEALQRQRDRVPPPAVNAVFVDVGIEKPEDVAITDLKMPRQIVPIGGRATISATLSATGREVDTVVSCLVDDQEIGRLPFKRGAGQNETLKFERGDLAEGPHQVKVQLAAADALPFNDIRHFTFEVRGSRKVLILTDSERDCSTLKTALMAGHAFQPDVMLVDSEAARRELVPIQMARYAVICLMNVKEPGDDLWERLRVYVKNGGGLAIIPGAEAGKGYGSKIAREFLPAQLIKVVAGTKEGSVWEDNGGQHPLLTPFRGNFDFTSEKGKPRADRYWEVEPAQPEGVIVRYADDPKRPALVERRFDRKEVRGRVLLMTEPLDDFATAGQSGPRWHNYTQNSSFYLVLTQEAVGYLAGDAEDGNFNFQCGQTVTVSLPARRTPTYTLQGPGIEGAEATITRADDQSDLVITKAVQPGNYSLYDSEGKRTANFSLNVAPEESVLTRVPVDSIETLLGKGSVIGVDAKTGLLEAIMGRWSQPVELFPWLMILLLLALAVENLLANKFYRKQAPIPTGNEGKVEVMEMVK